MSNEIMSKAFQIGLVLLVGAYVVSPIDLMPGLPFDDILVAALSAIVAHKAGKKMSSNTLG